MYLFQNIPQIEIDILCLSILTYSMVQSPS
jgi:hypothetical protein